MEKNAKIKLLGYILVATAAAGYYGYYLKSHELLAIWIVTFALGIAIIAALNNRIYKTYHSKLVYLDPLYVLFACLFPLIPLPHGISILAMMVLCLLYSIVWVRQAINKG